MPRYTDRWGLSILSSGDSLQSDGYKFTAADRELIDRLLRYACEEHHHTGGQGENLTPVNSLSLTLSTTGGTIASGARYYYRHTLIDNLGNESAPSPPAYIDTPGTVETPGAPAISYITGSGSLQPGGYSYVLSAYKGASTQETKAINSAFITIPGITAGNEVSLILPALPVGADGYNVYRKSPSGMHYLYITSVVDPAPLDVWVDDGSIEGDCDRSLPSVNRTGGTNAIAIALPDTPSLPGPWSWRVYRSTDPSRWGRSRLKDVNPIGNPLTTPLSFYDTGLATEAGGPPAKAQVINAPEKIELTDAREVTGSLPPGLLVVPQVLTFVAPGPVVVGEGTFTWVCSTEMADVQSVRAYLSWDSTPAADPVIVDVKALRPSKGSATWESLFSPEAPLPQVDVGKTWGAPAVPARAHLERGDALSIDIIQSGGGATPTDLDLSVNILLFVKDGSEDTSYDWNDQ